MKRKIGKIIWTLFLVICLSMSIGVVTTFADELEITDLETDEDYSENTVYSMLRGNNLSFGTTTVKKLASNKVGISGITQCHHNCDKVYLTLYLDRKVNGSYTEYKAGLLRHLMYPISLKISQLSFQAATTTESVATMQQKMEVKKQLEQ